MLVSPPRRSVVRVAPAARSILPVVSLVVSIVSIVSIASLWGQAPATFDASLSTAHGPHGSVTTAEAVVRWSPEVASALSGTLERSRFITDFASLPDSLMVTEQTEVDGTLAVYRRSFGAAWVGAGATVYSGDTHERGNFVASVAQIFDNRVGAFVLGPALLAGVTVGDDGVFGADVAISPFFAYRLSQRVTLLPLVEDPGELGYWESGAPIVTLNVATRPIRFASIRGFARYQRFPFTKLILDRTDEVGWGFIEVDTDASDVTLRGEGSFLIPLSGRFTLALGAMVEYQWTIEHTPDAPDPAPPNRTWYVTVGLDG